MHVVFIRSCRNTKDLHKRVSFSSGKSYSIIQGDCFSCIIRERWVSNWNQYAEGERNTADMKSVYVSEFINGGVYDETCNPPSTHNFCKIKFIQYNQIRYKIKNLLSCLGCEGKRWLPLMVLYWKWSVPVSFIITAHSQVSKWGEKKGLDNCTNRFFFFTFVIFVPGLNA